MDFDLKNKNREKLKDYHSTDFVDHDQMKNDNEVYEIIEKRKIKCSSFCLIKEVMLFILSIIDRDIH